MRGKQIYSGTGEAEWVLEFTFVDYVVDGYSDQDNIQVGALIKVS